MAGNKWQISDRLWEKMAPLILTMNRSKPPRYFDDLHGKTAYSAPFFYCLIIR
ncbi:Transposase [Morganella morganii]|jgi:hypothetical protein